MRNCYAIAAQSVYLLRNQFRLLRTHHEITTKSSRNHCAGTALHILNRFAVTAQLLYNRFTITLYGD
jgi:hypothetical protein